MKLDAMTMAQILDLTDAELEALSENEQRIVADIVAAVLDFELRHGRGGIQDPRHTAGQATLEPALAPRLHLL